MKTRLAFSIIISGMLFLFFGMDLCLNLPVAFADNVDEQQAFEDTNAQETESVFPNIGFMEKLEQGFELNLKATALGTITGIATSNKNPGNRFAQIPDKGIILTLKPDMSLVYDDWLFSAKPRLELEQNQWTIDGNSHNSSDQKAQIIEFKIRRLLFDNLFASYGCENLQWGPSFLYSPSNPFFNDNGKKNLVEDLKGKGFFKLVFVHDFSWSTSLIYNSDKGAFNESDFKKVLALKIDYSGDESYASLILSHKDNKETRLGLFGGTTLNDAVILYAEANLQQGSQALFPVALQNPLAWQLDAIKKDDHSLYTTLITGMGYTFESGDTMTLEYLYYGQGYDSKEASNYRLLKNTAASFYSSGTALAGYGGKVLGDAASNGLDFLRQNYLMVQYLNEDILEEIIDGIDLVSRLTYCLDDKSSRLYSSLSYDMNDHTELMLSGMMNTGGVDASFGTFLDYQVQVALEYSF